MPEMGGWEFAEVYRNLPGEPVPIVIISGRPGSFEATDWMRVEGYLQKPFGIDELAEVVNRYAPLEAQ
jgi:CheY-like chemotaxis protein